MCRQVLMIQLWNRGFVSLDRDIRGRAGFTLIEVMITAAILAFCICGLLLTYINLFLLADISRDLTLATNAMQAKMEEMKRVAFDCLLTSSSATCPAACNNTCFSDSSTFNLEGINEGKGRIEVSSVIGSGDLKRIRLVSCFRTRGRLIGEDSNLDGDLDAGEDTLVTDPANRLDSPMEFITLIAK